MIKEDGFVILNDHKLGGIGPVAKLIKCDGSGNTICKVYARDGIFYGFPVQSGFPDGFNNQVHTIVSI